VSVDVTPNRGVVSLSRRRHSVKIAKTVAGFSVTYSDFGAPVAATPPAASAVIDAPEIVCTPLNGE
jgi:hypothetical protein